METTEQAAWDQRYSGPDLVWGAGPNRFGGYDLVLVAYIHLPSASLARVFRTAAAAELDGLAVRRAEQVLRPVHAPEGEATAIDTLVRAERPSPPAAG